MNQSLEGELVVEMRGIKKHFGAVQALRGVDLALHRINAGIEAAHLAIIVIAISIALRLRRIPLGCSRRCNCNGRSGKRGGSRSSSAT